MTIPSTARKAGPLLGTGAQTAWPFTFKVFAAADVAVTIADSLGIETALVLDADYSVTLNVNQETSPGGTIIYPISGTPLPVGSVLSIVGDLDYDQPLDLPSGGNFSPLALENELDRTVMQIQQLREVTNRALQVPVTSNADSTLPAPEAQKILGWDVNGTGLQNYNIPDLFSGAVYADWIAQTFTGTGTQTLFVLQRAPGAVGNCDVSVDGQTYVPNVDFSLSGATLIFTVAPIAGAEILVRYGSAASQVASTFSTETQSATAGQTIFNLTSLLYNPGANALAVYVNGLRMVSGVDFLESDTDQVTFTSGLSLADEVLFIAGRTINDSMDASAVGYLPAGTGAVATTVQTKLRESVSVLDFGADPTGVADSTAAIQAAIDYATVNGHSLYVPAGHYLISSTLNLIRPSGEHRGDSFRIYGDGGGNIFLGTDLCPATVISTTTDIPIFTVPERYASGFNNLYVEYMRLQQDNAAATQPVVLLNSTSGYSRWANLEIKQLGLGDGIKIVKGYLITIELTNVVNKDFVAGSGTVRVGTGINVPSAQAGGLLTLRKVTSRGWLNAYIIGNGSTGLYATKMDQCECSTVTNGITIEAGVSKTSIDTCYFEGVYGKCVIDKGRSTTVSDCMMFNGFATGIDSTNTAVHGAVYRDNYILIDGTNSIGIDVYADGDALGHQKLIAGNHIFFISSGGSVAGVNGIKITGSNPSLSIIDNNFRPRREWVGGAGTIKINNASTGKITGVIPVTDTLFEFPMYSQAMISLAQGNTLTQSSVTSGDMAIGAGCSFDVNFSAATNITSINLGGMDERILLFRLFNTNATFVDSASGRLRMAGDFSGPGMIMFRTALIGGLTYAYEISRSTH